MAETSISSDWVRHSQLGAGLERIEAYFGGHGYAPHRHDTYALGLTLSGVQSFAYRRSQRHSLPGGAMVLHPDELHDGHAGTDAFAWRFSIADDPTVSAYRAAARRVRRPS